ncbi:MAG: hypothetical protein ABGY21_01435 [Pseudomonadota bacterium]
MPSIIRTWLVYEKHQHAFQEDFGARRQWSCVSGHIIRGSPVV